MAYWLFRTIIIGPLLSFFFRIRVIGLENVPMSGGVIFAANHQAVIDSFVIPAVINRQVTFLAKSEYFTGKGFVGRLKKRFFSVGAIPVDRDDRQAASIATDLMVSVVKAGGAVAIHPEGTRAPDARVYRGMRGAVGMAWRADVPIVPIALLGTRKANPPGSIFLRFGTRITIVIGEPMMFTDTRHGLHQIPGPPGVILLQRAQAEILMERIAELAGWQYVDIDARKAKKPQLA